MSQFWIEKLEAASSKVERDRVLLREWRELNQTYDAVRAERLRRDVEEQIVALADLAFSKETVI